MQISDEWVCQLVFRNDLAELTRFVGFGWKVHYYFCTPRVALHVAVELNRVPMIPLLRQMEYDFDSMAWVGYTPVELAIGLCHREMALCLVQHGATALISPALTRKFSHHPVPDAIMQETLALEDELRRARWKLYRERAGEVETSEGETELAAAEAIGRYRHAGSTR